MARMLDTASRAQDAGEDLAAATQFTPNTATARELLWYIATIRMLDNRPDGAARIKAVLDDAAFATCLDLVAANRTARWPREEPLLGLGQRHCGLCKMRPA